MTSSSMPFRKRSCNRVYAKFLVFLLFNFYPLSAAIGQHHAGEDCFICHTDFKIGGTVFSDTTAANVQPGVPLILTRTDGSQITLENSDPNGNIFSPVVPDGTYLMTLETITGRTWHTIPGQGSCNTCHIVGGNGGGPRTRRFPEYHTQIPPDNDCSHCHHFQASMNLPQLITPAVLNTGSEPPLLPGSYVQINGQIYPFDAAQYDIISVRPDIFAEGYFSIFDVILAVAESNAIPVEYYYDDSRKTHFITTLDNIAGDYWYHFSYDAGEGNSNEIQYRRANRWDETLWRSGVWISLVEGENLAEIKAEYLEEINRENSLGHMIPYVKIAINPSDYEGNPPESGRITVSREYYNVQLTAHNYRATGYPTPYSKPFQPGVVTSLDIPLSLMDQNELDVVTGVFYTHFAGNYIDSYYIVALGFPDVGTAHASGRQGFVYTTENGTYRHLPNNADRKFHLTCDISVIHAQDFSNWRWIELGNPYYESAEPLSVTDPAIDEDYKAIDRGFNLHAPYPNPFKGSVQLTFNIIEPGQVDLAVYNAAGQKVARLYDNNVKNIGIHEVTWQPGPLSSGIYYLVMKYENDMQVRSISFVK